MKTFWGIDLGGTKIEGVVLNEDKKVLSRQRLPTEQEHGAQHIVEQIGRVVDILKTETGQTPTAIGIGTPGTTDPILKTLKNSNTVCLNGFPLHKALENHLGITVKMANDANCFALAEAKMGAVPEILPDATVVFGVIMGTGVGGGIVINGQVINGRQGIGGEWGHNFLDVSGGECYCGKVGCTEKVIAGPSLERFYKKQSGVSKKLKDIVEAYRSDNDTHATATMERLFHFFGLGISNIINVIDPDVIVLGGGVSNIGELYTKGVAQVEKHVFNHRLDTIFAKPKLGDSAGVFGAAMLVS